MVGGGLGVRPANALFAPPALARHSDGEGERAAVTVLTRGARVGSDRRKRRKAALASVTKSMPPAPVECGEQFGGIAELAASARGSSNPGRIGCDTVEGAAGALARSETDTAGTLWASCGRLGVLLIPVLAALPRPPPVASVVAAAVE